MTQAAVIAELLIFDCRLLIVRKDQSAIKIQQSAIKFEQFCPNRPVANGYPSIPSFKVVEIADTRMALTTFSAAHASEDARLVRAARAGDERAFGALYERYARVIHGVLLSRAPKTDVEDLVQDVFLSAWNRLESLRDPAAFGGWLTMIARNRATDFHRQSVDCVELPDDLTAPEASSARAEALGVLEIIRTLPAAYRETLVLRLVEGLTGPEIAERTGLTPASVRVNLHRGMTMLREKLER
jgi:RNA polymerase sigma-70 factor, ECF subfamily